MKRYLLYIFILFLFSNFKTPQENNCTIITSETTGSTAYENLEIQRITYRSDGLKISGFIIKPTETAIKLPILLVNRGGNRNFGAITNTRYLEYLASQGYVVMASNYRGNDFSEGIDEFGGNDLNDITCLIEIAKTLPYADTDHIGVIGYSRGGLMAFLLAKHTSAIKTIITVGAPTDLFLSAKNRPGLYQEVYKELIGDTLTHRKAYEDRSVLYWYKQLNIPALVIHGDADTRVSLAHTQRLMDSLQQIPNQVTPLIIKGGDHGLSNFRELRNDTINKWFAHYLK